MEKVFDQNENNLIELLESKDFSQLSPDESSYVLEHMSKEDYILRRSVIVETAQDNDTPSLPSSIDKAVFAYLEENDDTPIIPIWQSKGFAMMLSAAVAAILVWIILPFKDVEIIKGETKETTVYQTKIDTVFQEKLKLDTIVVEKPQIVYVSNTPKAPQNQMCTPIEIKQSNPSVAQSSQPAIDISNIDLSNKGSSAKSDNNSLVLSPVNP